MDEKYSILGTTLKDIADSVRSVIGTAGKLTPTNMQSDLNTYSSDMNTELTSQETLINQIKSTLASKTSGKVELPVLSNPASGEHILSGYEAIDGTGFVLNGTFSPRTFVSGTKSITSKSNKITIPDLVGKENFVITLNVSGHPDWDDNGILTLYKNGDSCKVMTIPSAGSGLGDMMIEDTTLTISSTGVITIKSPQNYFAPLKADGYIDTMETEYIYFGF